MTSQMCDRNGSGSIAASEWDASVRPSVSEQLTRQVMEPARKQRLQPGDRLPSVQALVSMFSVAAPLSGDDRLVVSYNVSSFVVQDVYRNVEDYRPRFIDVRLREG